MPEIENVTITEMRDDGELRGYKLSPNTGYVLHNAINDQPVFDENNEETGEMTPYFCTGDTTVRYDYDFDKIVEDTYLYKDENGMEIALPISKIGKYEFYAIPNNAVQESQKY